MSCTFYAKMTSAACSQKDVLVEHSLNYLFCDICEAHVCKLYSSKLLFFDQTLEAEMEKEKMNMTVNKPRIAEIVKVASSKRCVTCGKIIPTPLSKIHSKCLRCIRDTSMHIPFMVKEIGTTENAVKVTS